MKKKKPIDLFRHSESKIKRRNLHNGYSRILIQDDRDGRTEF